MANRDGHYLPTYETLFSLIQQSLGDQPPTILSAIANEMLGILKSYEFDDEGMMKAISTLLEPVPTEIAPRNSTPMDSEVLAGLCLLKNDIKKFQVPFDDDQYVAGPSSSIVSDEETSVDINLSCKDIHAYWLQKIIWQLYEKKIDAQQCQKVEDEILRILAEVDEREEAVTKLSKHIDFTKVFLAKYLFNNRLKIVWCTRLARAKDKVVRKKIEEEMVSLAPDILEQLRVSKRGLIAKDPDSGWVNCNRNLLDLDSIVLNQGTLQMGNNNDLVTEYYIMHESEEYKEIHIPALPPTPWEPGEELVLIDAMPYWTREAFEDIGQLNRVQSRVYRTALHSHDNILLCAPSRSGKTNVAMLTILRELAISMNEGRSFKHKIVYLAQTKALVAGVAHRLSRRLSRRYEFIQVKELSGDQFMTREKIREAHIIVSTPDKWEIVQRQSQDWTYKFFVRLLILDDIHALHDKRGPVLESIVARTVRQNETTEVNTRFVGLSNTFANYHDVALFLRVDLNNGLFYFNNSYRECPIAQQFIGICVENPLQQLKLMNAICYRKTMASAIVHSRGDTEPTACTIRDVAVANNEIKQFMDGNDEVREDLEKISDTLQCPILKSLFGFGVAFHHADMHIDDREAVEQNFIEGALQVLVSTSDFTWDVHLSAPTVIIKGTKVYNPEKGAWTELSPFDVMQILGRGGGPQYDTHGEGIVITSNEVIEYYMSVMNGKLSIESQFISKLVDQLNTEIMLGTVHNAKEAVQWIMYTFLHTCMVRNPILYGMAPGATIEERSVDLFVMANRDGHYLPTYETLFSLIQQSLGDQPPTILSAVANEMLGILKSYEFDDEGMMKAISTLLEPVPTEIAPRNSTPMTSEVLAGLCLLKNDIKKFQVPFDDDQYVARPSSSIVSDEETSVDINLSCKDIHAYWLQKIIWQLYEKKIDAQQCQKVEDEILRILAEVDEREEAVTKLSKHIDFTKVFLAKYLFNNRLKIVWCTRLARPKDKVVRKKIEEEMVSLAPDILEQLRVSERGLIAKDPDSGWVNCNRNLLDLDSIVLNQGTLQMGNNNDLVTEYYIMHESEEYKEIHIPALPPTPWEPGEELVLIDAMPYWTREAFEDIGQLNRVQSRVYRTALHSHDNILLCAPSRSGKTNVAMLTILRELAISMNEGRSFKHKIVYLAQTKALVAGVAHRLSRRLSRRYEFIQVKELSGDQFMTREKIREAHIIVSTPDKWEIVQRQSQDWTYKFFVRLLILDDIHALHDKRGPVLESIVARTVRQNETTEVNTRFVGLSNTFANYHDVALFLRVDLNNGLFYFNNSYRECPIAQQFIGICVENPLQQLKLMNAICYRKTMASAIVHSRGDTEQTACTIRDVAVANSEIKQFMDGNDEVREDLEKISDTLQCPILKSLFGFGVAFHHADMHIDDREAVEQNFIEGALQVLVSTSDFTWDVHLSAPTVIIKGTKVYNPEKGAWTELSPFDVMQILGRGGGPQYDTHGEGIVITSNEVIEYYMSVMNGKLSIVLECDSTR